MEHPSRRRVLKASALLTARLGLPIPYLRFLPAGMAPIALASPEGIEGKDALTILNDRPLNAETPAHLLDDPVTPASRLFVRNNGIPPSPVDERAWRLEIAGEACERPQSFSIAELKAQFKTVSYQLQLECGGNGRGEFVPPAGGNQWTTGAVGCPRWTGVRLKDVLEHCGVARSAVYIGYYGADRHLSGDPNKSPISRGVPIAKALEPESLIAFAMNDEPIPALHGFPLRLVLGGWPGSVSGKWLNKLVVRDRVHDGAKMLGQSYRVPCQPVAPGAEVANEDLCIIESMPVKSLVTFPESGVRHGLKEPLEVRGHAWAGDRRVVRLHTSIDFGATWQRARLERPANRLAWQRWRTSIRFPEPGYYEIWARAQDEAGVQQPLVLPGWNPKGYLNNAAHRIAVAVSA